MSQSPAELTTLAYYWIVQRPDGGGFAATSHDRGQQIGSMTLEPNLDLRPDELNLTDEMFGSSLELEGGLTNGALAIRDLHAERWSGASVQLLAGDWREQAEPTLICEGALGRVRLTDNRAAMTVDLLPAAARHPPCIQTSPECRAILGDRQCRVDMRSRRKRVQVTGLVPGGVTVNLEEDAPEFAMGRLRWTTGVNTGLEQVIMAVDGATLLLHDKSGQMATIGDHAILTEGCDGKRLTCSERFANILNFRGEPDLPGSEILLRFPGA